MSPVRRVSPDNSGVLCGNVEVEVEENALAPPWTTLGYSGLC